MGCGVLGYDDDVRKSGRVAGLGWGCRRARRARLQAWRESGKPDDGGQGKSRSGWVVGEPVGGVMVDDAVVEKPLDRLPSTPALSPDPPTFER